MNHRVLLGLAQQAVKLLPLVCAWGPTAAMVLLHACISWLTTFCFACAPRSNIHRYNRHLAFDLQGLHFGSVIVISAGDASTQRCDMTGQPVRRITSSAAYGPRDTSVLSTHSATQDTHPCKNTQQQRYTPAAGHTQNQHIGLGDLRSSKTPCSSTTKLINRKPNRTLWPLEGDSMLA